MKRSMSIMAPSLWAFIVCVFIKLCMMILSPLATDFGRENVLFANTAAVVGLQHGEEWIWDTGASMDLIGKQDAMNIMEKDKIMFDPPISIDTASGKTSVDFSVEAYCNPIGQTVTPLVMAAATRKVISTGVRCVDQREMAFGGHRILRSRKYGNK